MKKNKVKIFLFLTIVISTAFPFIVYSFLPNQSQLYVNAVIDIPLSIVEIPICYSQKADQLGIQSDDIRSFVLESLKPGMTSSEVEATLTRIAPISIDETYAVEATQIQYASVKVDLCDNPYGDMYLDVFYSTDGKLTRWEDAWGDN